jgi:hypothetical protein
MRHVGYTRDSRGAGRRPREQSQQFVFFVRARDIFKLDLRAPQYA